MAYSLHLISHFGGNGGNSHWALYTTDAASAVYGTGGSAYITDAHNHDLSPGDLVDVVKVTTLPATSPSQRDAAIVVSVTDVGTGPTATKRAVLAKAALT